MSKNMIMAIIFVVSIIAGGMILLQMAKESGKREYEQKQAIATAERQEAAKKVTIEVSGTPISDIREKMKKFTRD